MQADLHPSAHARHRFEEHTGEVRISLWAPSLEGLFAEAGRALAELQAPGAPRHLETHGPVLLEARDREALLVRWLDELIYRTDTTGHVFTRFRFSHLDDTRLVATLEGGPPVAQGVVVKAATFHGLRLEPDGGGLRASVVLDV